MENWSRTRIVLTLSAFFIPIAILFGLAGKAYDSYELNHYGVKAYGVVTNHHQMRGGGARYTIADMIYNVNGKILNGTVDDDDLLYKTNDTLVIMYSFRYPTTYSVIGIKKNGVEKPLP